MTRQSDGFVDAIMGAVDDAKRHADLARPLPAIVESVNVDAGTMTLQFGGAARGVSLEVGAAQGVLPPVGTKVICAMNGPDPVPLTRPGTVIEGGWFSSNFPGFDQGGPGWGIDCEGNAEFNGVVVRGDLTFQPDELIANGHFDTTIDPWTDDGVANVDVTRVVPPGGGFAALVEQTVSGVGPAPMAHSALPVTAGKTYRLDAAVYPIVRTAPFQVSHVTVRLRWLDDTAATISESSGTPTLLPGEWNNAVAFAAVAPAGAVEVIPLFVATLDLPDFSDGPGAYVDNVHLVEVSRVVRGHLEDCTAGTFTVDGDLRVGGNLLAPRVGCHVSRASPMNFNNSAFTLFSFDSEFDDTHGFLAPTTTNVVIPAGMGGVYVLAAFAKFVNLVTYTLVLLRVKVDGTVVSMSPPISNWSPGAGEGVAVPTPPIRFHDGDVVTLELLQVSGATRQFTAEMTLYRIGA